VEVHSDQHQRPCLTSLGCDGMANGFQVWERLPKGLKDLTVALLSPAISNSERVPLRRQEAAAVVPHQPSRVESSGMVTEVTFAWPKRAWFCA
jgi:hypothetical protein